MGGSGRSLRMTPLLLGAASGLMFRSHNVTSQWDTWAFVENGTYYVYYLVTEHSPGEGFGVATSPNGQHWTDRGYVFHGPSWTEHRWWQGTGSVWRAPDYNTTGRYLINWSQDPGRYQNITFGQSFDLIHWTPLDTYFDIDERYYNLPGRWDCIYTIPAPEARRPTSNPSPNPSPSLTLALTRTPGSWAAWAGSCTAASWVARSRPGPCSSHPAVGVHESVCSVH